MNNCRKEKDLYHELQGKPTPKSSTLQRLLAAHVCLIKKWTFFVCNCHTSLERNWCQQHFALLRTPVLLGQLARKL